MICSESPTLNRIGRFWLFYIGIPVELIAALSLTLPSVANFKHWRSEIVSYARRAVMNTCGSINPHAYSFIKFESELWIFFQAFGFKSFNPLMKMVEE